MIWEMRHLQCDFCTSGSYRDECSDDTTHREMAFTQLGWCFIRVKNGSLHDCCPACRSKNNGEIVLDPAAKDITIEEETPKALMITPEYIAGLRAAAEHCETSEGLLPVEAFLGTKQAFGATLARKLAEELREKADKLASSLTIPEITPLILRGIAMIDIHGTLRTSGYELKDFEKTAWLAAEEWMAQVAHPIRQIYGTYGTDDQRRKIPSVYENVKE